MLRYILMLMFLIIASNVYAQEMSCYKYGFQPNDTLIYDISSHDSIIIGERPALIKDRSEKLRVVCLGIDDNIMSIQLKLLSSISEEKSEGKKSTRKTSPWIGREIILKIDSSGARHGYEVDDSTLVSVSTGGAFKPTLFLAIDTNCAEYDKPWIDEGLIDLAENSVPPAKLRYMSYFKAKKPLDTLGYECNKLNYARTGQGDLSINTLELKLQMTSIINSTGNIYFCQNLQIPIFFYQTIEEKLTIYRPDGNKEQGKHFTNTYYKLEYINR